MPHIVDTVALIRHLQNSPLLGRRARAVLDDPNSQLLFPTIVFAEAYHLIVSRRLPLNFRQILASIQVDPRCAIYPLDVDVLLAVPPPPVLEMHDGIVCATAAIVAAQLQVSLASIPILTSDRAITAYAPAAGLTVLW